MLSKEEIDAAAGERSRQIALDEFVCAEEIDPVFYDHTYYLGAGKDGEDAYRLLHEALGRSARAGIGRWVFHNREYMVAVRALDGALALHTMRYADELVDPGDLDVPEPSRKPGKREIDMAGQLVESLHKKFKANAFEDRYRDAVLELIKRKAEGEEISVERPEEPQQTDDLMAALEASLSGSSGNGKNGSGGGGRGKKSKGKR
jgi:DNA end-binding protein Ku